MCSTSMFTCIMAMVPSFLIFFSIFIFKLFFTIITDFWIFIWFSCSYLLITSLFFILKLIIFFACSLKDSQNFFMQFPPLYTSCLFSMSLNDDIQYLKNLKNLKECVHLLLLQMTFQDYFCIHSFFIIKGSRSA